jgi:hypothetical protein
VIPVTYEDVEALKQWGMGLEHVLERCIFCRAETRYWHLPTNTSVCEQCATTRTVADLKAAMKESK